MSYPVHQGRLDHSALPLPTTGLPQAVWHTNSKALFLSAHDDYLLGHADNGAWPPPPKLFKNFLIFPICANAARACSARL